MIPDPLDATRDEMPLLLLLWPLLLLLLLVLPLTESEVGEHEGEDRMEEMVDEEQEELEDVFSIWMLFSGKEDDEEEEVGGRVDPAFDPNPGPDFGEPDADLSLGDRERNPDFLLLLSTRDFWSADVADAGAVSGVTGKSGSGSPAVTPFVTTSPAADVVTDEGDAASGGVASRGDLDPLR